MSIVFQSISAFARVFGGRLGPGGMIEARFVGRRLPSGGYLVDAGGGEGRLAGLLVRDAALVIVLDREETLGAGADNSIYAGSLSRLRAQRLDSRIVPVHGDARQFPFAAESLNGVVSCQLLEHLDIEGRKQFFVECARCLKPGGVLAISTPWAASIEGYPFAMSSRLRNSLPKHWVRKMPRSLRGYLLERTFEEWEIDVGHIGHGCSPEQLSEAALNCGLRELERRATHTRLTQSWLELTFTLPLLAMIATPLARLLYEIEWRLPPATGLNLLMSFQKEDIS